MVALRHLSFSLQNIWYDNNCNISTNFLVVTRDLKLADLKIFELFLNKLADLKITQIQEDLALDWDSGSGKNMSKINF